MSAPITWNERQMEGELPQDCIEECSEPGRDAQEAVTHWRERLAFEPPRAHAIAFLRETGAWDDLEEASDETLAERVLWIFANDAAEAQSRGDEPFYYLGS